MVWHHQTRCGHGRSGVFGIHAAVVHTHSSSAASRPKFGILLGFRGEAPHWPQCIWHQRRLGLLRSRHSGLLRACCLVHGPLLGFPWAGHTTELAPTNVCACTPWLGIRKFQSNKGYRIRHTDVAEDRICDAVIASCPTKNKKTKKRKHLFRPTCGTSLNLQRFSIPTANISVSQHQRPTKGMA